MTSESLVPVIPASALAPTVWLPLPIISSQFQADVIWVSATENQTCKTLARM